MQDLVYIGRLLRIPGFDGPDVEDGRRAFVKANGVERKARKALKDGIRQAAAVTHGKTTRHEQDDPVKVAIRSWVSTMRALLVEYILRRTTASKGPDGKPISELEPYEVVHMVCKLRPDEMEVQEALANDLIESDVSVGAGGVKVSVDFIADHVRRLRPPPRHAIWRP